MQRSLPEYVFCSGLRVSCNAFYLVLLYANIYLSVDDLSGDSGNVPRSRTETLGKLISLTCKQAF